MLALRLDRFITLYVRTPLVSITGMMDGPCIPVLVYHSISDNLFGMSHPYRQINTSSRQFSRQMRWLKEQGYESIDLKTMWSYLESGTNLNKKVVITFDDGYRDLFTEALPLMKQLGFTATVFLISDRIQDSSLKIEGADYLTWSDVRTLVAEEFQIGSHTATHADLRSSGPEQIEYEVGYSKEAIEQRTGTSVTSFAYPFPFPEHDKRFAHYLADTLANFGYEYGLSSIIGRTHTTSDRFMIPRLAVNSWDDSPLFRAKLEGYYDWVHLPQRLYKAIYHNPSPMDGTDRFDAEDTN